MKFSRWLSVVEIRLGDSLQARSAQVHLVEVLILLRRCQVRNFLAEELDPKRVVEYVEVLVKSMAEYLLTLLLPATSGHALVEEQEERCLVVALVHFGKHSVGLFELERPCRLVALFAGSCCESPVAGRSMEVEEVASQRDVEVCGLLVAYMLRVDF